MARRPLPHDSHLLVLLVPSAHGLVVIIVQAISTAY